MNYNKDLEQRIKELEEKLEANDEENRELREALEKEREMADNYCWSILLAADEARSTLAASGSPQQRINYILNALGSIDVILGAQKCIKNLVFNINLSTSEGADRFRQKNMEDSRKKISELPKLRSILKSTLKKLREEQENDDK